MVDPLWSPTLFVSPFPPPWGHRVRRNLALMIVIVSLVGDL